MPTRRCFAVINYLSIKRKKNVFWKCHFFSRIKIIFATRLFHSTHKNNTKEDFLDGFSVLCVTRESFHDDIIYLLNIFIKFLSLWGNISVLLNIFPTDAVFYLSTKAIIRIKPQLQQMYNICDSNYGGFAALWKMEFCYGLITMNGWLYGIPYGTL